MKSSVLINWLINPINSSIFIGQNLALSLEPLTTSSTLTRMTYVYLTSVEHSGSTLLACLLGAHPDVTSIGEFAVDFPNTLRCPCGASVSDCRLWSAWQIEARRLGIDFEIGNFGINMLPGPAASFWRKLYYHQFPVPLVNRCKELCFTGSKVKVEAKQQLEKSVELAKILCEQERTNIFLDSSKNPLQIRHLARRDDVNLKMIGVVRDGRAVMKSVVQKEKYSTDQAIGSWMWGNKHLLRAARHLPRESFYLLKLEDLCESPKTVTRELFTFLGVDPDTDLDFCTQSRHVVGNNMRLSFDGQIRPHDDSWKSFLDKNQLAMFEKHAGAMNRRFGYSD